MDQSFQRRIRYYLDGKKARHNFSAKIAELVGSLVNDLINPSGLESMEGRVRR